MLISKLQIVKRVFFFYVDNQDFLTPLQEKQMSFQPDFILEYAHFLGDHFKSKGHKNIQVFVESYVALNGRLSQPFINKNIDLYQQKETFNPKEWAISLLFMANICCNEKPAVKIINRNFIIFFSHNYLN